jgi:hypothetical protein
MPVSFTLIAADESSLRTLSEIRPPGSVNFAALCRMLPIILHETRLVPFDCQQLVGKVQRELVTASVDRRPRRFDGSRDDGADQHRLALERNHVARDARHVQQIVNQTDELLDLAFDHLPGTHALHFGQLPQPQQLYCRANRRQWIPQFVREHRQEFIFAPIRLLQGVCRSFECRGPLGDSLLQVAVQPFERPRLSIKVREDADFRAQDLWNDRHRDVVDGTAFVAAQPVEIGHVHRGHEDERRLLEPRVLPDHRRQLVTVQLRHAHVNQHDGDLGAQQALESLGRRVHLDEVLAESAKDRLVRHQLRRLVIDQQDIHSIDPRCDGHERIPICGTTSGAMRAAVLC